MKQQIIAWVGAASVVVLAGCTQSMAQQPGHGAMSMPMASTSGTKAAELRAGLNNLFSEHVYLAGAATNAAGWAISGPAAIVLQYYWIGSEEGSWR